MARWLLRPEFLLQAMAYQFTCPASDCGHTIRGETVSEVVSKAKEHATDKHLNTDWSDKDIQDRIRDADPRTDDTNEGGRE